MTYQQWQSMLRMAEDAISRAGDGCADKDEFGQSSYVLNQLDKAIKYLEEAKEGYKNPPVPLRQIQWQDYN